MKAVFLLLTVLFTASPSFAEKRAILVEVTVQPNRNGPSTVNIYSADEEDQCLDASVKEAAAVLQRVQQPMDGVDVSILINGWVDDQDLWLLLDGLRRNKRHPELIFLEMDRFYSAGEESLLSDKAKRLQAFFKTPMYTKKRAKR